MVFIRTTLGLVTASLLLGGCRDQSPVIVDSESIELAEGVVAQSLKEDGNSWQVITMDPSKSRPSIRLLGSNKKPLRSFKTFQDTAHKNNENIIWMMNAGMYHKGGFPVGLCICDGKEISSVNQSEGDGNFFLKPNGIFFLTPKGAQIIESSEWNPAIAPSVECATQSGPLLVRKGQLHPAIRKNSPNQLIRNGVGIRKDGQLCFVISITPVTFHDMATFFRDHLDCPDALYLDGSVSALYAPKAKLTPDATNLGPVLGLWISRSEPSNPKP